MAGWAGLWRAMTLCWKATVTFGRSVPTAREQLREVLEWVARGRSDARIAQGLFITSDRWPERYGALDVSASYPRQLAYTQRELA